ncbi:type VII secretion integral membrane protein EccD [Mycobacterium angelicum]|uniref:Type VII secretion integral membrane protein EccD n=1 Tax=Mycobacterium angelicum TaxID=470074 RepID=A0A1W9ZS00_MYCAN|nr:type VII secretion integral membrane protein EccD [Mycobacterium angelicum]MCV7195539.1 type VII secretion integral membrane protein EccD [Mycobacterium angelicum]ORA20587.1 type VII secretion integral membrane protein EccD [Mycobacterium angelicum]
MTSGTVMPIVRVAILAESRLTEMALPAELPLREILPAVQRLVVPATGDADGGEPESGAAVHLSLAPIGGAPFSLDASLDTVGVVDGDLLALQPVPAGPAAPGIVEDIADAAMIFSASRLKAWGTTHIQRGALAAVIAVTLLATGLSVTYRVATGALAGLVAVSAIAAVIAIVGLLISARSPRTGVALSVAALVPIGAALALAVPGRFGPAQILLAAAGVTAWSLIALMVPSAEREREVAFFTAVAVFGAGILLAAGALLLWQLPLRSIGCGLIVAALLVTIQAAQLSALWARFPLPVIPAPGDPTPSAPSLRVLEDLPRRVRVSDAHQSGFIAAAVLLSALGSVAIALRPDTLSVVGWYVVAATGATAALRARVWDSAACKAWLLAQPHLVAGTLLVIYTATGHYAAALGAALVLAVLVLAWVVVALNPGIASPDSYSLPLRRLLGFVAAGLDASLIPVMAYLVGLFTWVLNR